MVGEGIDGLFGYIVRLFVEPGVTVATSLGAYPTFNFHVAGFGGRLVTTPYVNDREDPDSLLALASKEKARLLFLANPDNPMGSWWDGATVQALIARLPAGTVLCLDEAYCEFAPAGTTPPIDVANPQVIRFRTFSKAYGMAGARIGYAIGEAGVIKSFDKIRNHFGVNRIAQAGALAALADEAHLKWVLDQVAASRDRIAAIGRANGLAAAAVGHQFRHHGLRPRRRLCAPGAGRAHQPRRLRAHARRRAARPLHPRQRGDQGRSRCVRGDAAGGVEGGSVEHGQERAPRQRFGEGVADETNEHPANANTATLPWPAGSIRLAMNPKAGMKCIAWVAKKCATRRSPPSRAQPIGRQAAGIGVAAADEVRAVAGHVACHRSGQHEGRR